MTRIKFWLAALLFLISTLAMSCDIAQVGPCVHTYREPVLTIQRARDATGNAVATVVLDSLSLNGRLLGPPYGLVTTEPAFRVTADSSALTCTVPCGFGTEPGQYEFRASAPGFSTTRVTVSASYGTFHGGCPSWNDDGTQATLSLQRP